MAVLTIAAGILVLLFGLAPLVGLIAIGPPSRSRDLIHLAIVGIGLAIVVVGRRLWALAGED